MAQQGQENLGHDTALTAFRALSFKQQLPFLARVLYAELLANGRASNVSALREAITAMRNNDLLSHLPDVSGIDIA
jgi:hypothetical protein